ncbi:class I SAM-dependent methyltransferase [Actinoplanes sp. NPDC049596]|uniref:class I SAM-dependent methyltransferase n=1 Tax=unclassified Actinoplanes TaxID=2626549 RepID=UPI00341E854E
MPNDAPPAGGPQPLSPVVAHFDGVADAYDQVLPFFAAFATQALRHLDTPPGTRALDLAAGRGAFTSQLLHRGCDVTAVDGSPRMIEHLRRDHPGLDARVMDATRLDLPDDTYDLIVCGFAIHIITDPYAALAEALRVALRVARPGATLAFTVPAAGVSDPLTDLYAHYRQYQPDGSGRHGNDLDLTRTRLAGLTETPLEVSLPVPDGETYWRWSRSHGSGRFIDGLPAAKRTEMHDRLLQRLAGRTDFALRRSATLWTARKP